MDSREEIKDQNGSSEKWNGYVEDVGIKGTNDKNGKKIVFRQ